MSFERPGIKKSLDCDLLQLVGDYLASNSERSYINMEDMVDAIQSRSYRFGRMKRLTFAAMVKRAYQRYLQMQAPVMQSPLRNPPNDDYMTPVSSANVKVALPETPTQANYSSDSDVEIVLDDSITSPATPKTDSNPTPHATSSSNQEQVNKKPRMEQSVIKSAGSSTSNIVKVDREISGTSGNSEVNSNAKNEKPRGVKRKLDEDGPAKPPAKGLEGLLQKRTKRQIPVLQVTDVSFEDFAGGEKVIEEICQLLLHLKHPEIYKTIGVTPPRGFLLHGPPGCGKSLLANAIAGELKLPMLKVAATELISGISGESESNIRDLFQQALDLAPCMIFLDEIDSITPKRETAQREMERRIVAQLLACMDELSTKEKGDAVVLIGATNRIETIDSALRRAGRFDREISIGIPDEQAREKILRVICKNLRLTDGFQFSQLAKLTPGYVGADLQSLAREAAVHAINEVLNISGGAQQIVKEQQPSETVTSQPKPEEDKESSAKGMTSEASPIVMNGTATTSKEDDCAADSTVGDTHVENKSDDDVIAIESEDSNMEVDNSNVKTPSSSSSNKVLENQTPTSEASDDTQSTLDSNDESKLNLSLQSNLSPSKSNQSPPSSKWIRDIAPLTDVQLNKIFIEMKHFQSALKYIQPSSKREGFATVPDITWDDIGALKEVRDELQVSILGPVKYPEAFYAFGISNPAGVLLCGPPGCGKTLLAKAVANEAGINFISVKGPELLNMYVGESERAVRQCFLRAKNSSPCVIFFDELDALCPRRSDGADGNSTSRVVNQLLTEMDGIESRLGVYIMAASNRPDIIDPAVLRPGRLDKILFVNIPTVEDRVDILETITKKGTKPVLDADVNLREIAENESCSCYTGADLAALVREAAVAAFRELVLGPHLSNAAVPAFDQLKVSGRHFEAAFRKIKPSVSKRDLEKYAAMKEKYSVLSAQS